MEKLVSLIGKTGESGLRKKVSAHLRRQTKRPVACKTLEAETAKQSLWCCKWLMYMQQHTLLSMITKYISKAVDAGESS